jgi:molybdate transport system ATP-binding protein
MLEVSIQHTLSRFALDVTFEAPAGLTVLFGRSGSGKTSIVNAVAGVLRPDAGRIVVSGSVLTDSTNGLHLPPNKRRLGVIFQDARLFPHLTVAGNLSYGRKISRRPRDPRKEAHVVSMLGLEALLARRPGALSGGEKQRVAIGRALLTEPQLILADEPLASLDEARKAEILPYFERLRDEFSVPILYVSHAPAEVARLATTVVALDQGRVVGSGNASEILSNPSVLPTGARGAGALLSARVLEHHPDGLSELLAGDVRLFLPHVHQKPGTFLRIRIAASEVMISKERPEGLSALNVIPGEVQSVRSGAGPGALVELKTTAGPLLARITARSAKALGLSAGADCFAVLKAVAVAPEDVGRLQDRQSWAFPAARCGFHDTRLNVGGLSRPKT